MSQMDATTFKVDMIEGSARGKRAGVAFAIARGNDPVTTKYAKSDEVWSANKEFATDAVHGSAVNENQSAKFERRISMRSGLNIMEGERRGIQVNQPNANQARVQPQDPPSKEMNQRINGVQSILKQGNKKRSPNGHNDRKGKDKKFTQRDKQSNSGCRSGENLQHYAWLRPVQLRKPVSLLVTTLIQTVMCRSPTFMARDPAVSWWTTSRTKSHLRAHLLSCDHTMGMAGPRTTTASLYLFQ